MIARLVFSLLLLSLPGCTQSGKFHALFVLGLPPGPLIEATSLPRVTLSPSQAPGAEPTPPPTNDSRDHFSDTPVVAPVVTNTSGGGSGGGGSGGGAPAPPANEATVASTGSFNLAWLAGRSPDGPAAPNAATAHVFRQLAGIVAAADGSVVVCDRGAHQIIRLTAGGNPVNLCGTANGEAGYWGEDLPATASALDRPTGLAMDQRNGVLYLADAGNHRIRHFMPGGRIYTLAGGGPVVTPDVDQATDAALGEVHGLVLDERRNAYFSEVDTGRVRRVDAGGRLETLATLTPGATGALAANTAGTRLWVAHGGVLSVLDLAASPVAVAQVWSLGGAALTGLAYDQRRTLYVSARSAAGAGNAGTRVWALDLANSGLLLPGRPPAVVAGLGLASDTSADYALPMAVLPDARAQALAGQGPCSLAIDLTQSASETVLSGILLAGSSFASVDSTVRWGQLARLEPLP